MMSTTERPQFSIVLSVNEDSIESLKDHLPALMAQQYEPGFEVIVVNESPGRDMQDMLDVLKSTYPQLYITFIPQGSHYLSRRKLALTLGVKAAHYNWVVFTEADCQPATHRWLETIASYIHEDTDMVCGYTRYTDNTSMFLRYERMRQWNYQYLKAVRRRPYAYNGCNLAIRRQLFMEHNGFLTNLRYLRGEYDFMVNEYAEPYRTAAFNDPDGVVVQDAPTKEKWKMSHIYYQETRRHLHRSWGYQVKPFFDTLMLHLTYGLLLIPLVYAIITENWILTTVSGIALILLFVYRVLRVRRVANRYGEHFPLLTIPLMEIRVLWQNLYFIIRYYCTSETELIRR